MVSDLEFFCWLFIQCYQLAVQTTKEKIIKVQKL